MRCEVTADLMRYGATQEAHERRDNWIEEKAEALMEPGAWADPFSDENLEEGSAEFFGNMSKAEGEEFGRQLREDPCAAGMALRAGLVKYWRELAESRAETEYEPGGE